MRNRCIGESERDTESMCRCSIIWIMVSWDCSDTQNSCVSYKESNSHTSTLHSVLVIVNNCSLFFHRPYFELKAKYYVQLEVRV